MTAMGNGGGRRLRLRELWDRGEPTYGGWCIIPSPFSVELMGCAGHDWVCIDTQHGIIGYDQLLLMIQAVSGTGTPAFVRVSWNNPPEIMKALDAGAEGVIVPLVNSPEEAERAVGAMRYPPHGYRSWGSNRHALYNPSFAPEHGNRTTICAIMIETPAAVERIDEILDVPGIDAVYVGPADLAVTSGFSPSTRTEEPEYARLIDRILESCHAHNVVPGIQCHNPSTARQWRDAGFKMIAVHADAALLRQAAERHLQELREDTEEQARSGLYM